MDPTAEELAAMTTLDHAQDWVGIVDTPVADPPARRRMTRSSFLETLGGPTLVRLLVAIPHTVYTETLALWRVATLEADDSAGASVAPTAVEQGQAGSMRRVCRLLMRLNPDESVGPAGHAGAGVAPATQTGAAAGFATQAATPPSARKVITSKVLDQGDDTEVKPMTADELRTLTVDWIRNENDGEEPLEEEEATADQVSALDARIKAGGTPFVDFGIFRPYGLRLGRALKFAVYHMDATGQLHTKEINGPASFEDWLKCWNVFVFAMTLLKQAARTRLSRYASRISKMMEDYPNMWWIVGQADIIMRSEHLPRIHRRCLAAHAAGTMPEFDPAKPWGIAFREAAADDKFWQEKVDKKVVLYAAHLADASALQDPGYGSVYEVGANDVFRGQKPGATKSGKKKRADSSSSASGKGKKKQPKKKKKAKKVKENGAGGKAQDGKGKGAGKQADPNSRRPDGRYWRDSAGKPLCWAFNHKADGCSATCPQGRVHKCEFCREAHRSIECPRKPSGWSP